MKLIPRVAALLVLTLIAALPAAARDRSQGDLLMGSHRYAEAEQAYREELKTAAGVDEAAVLYAIGGTLKARYLMDDAIAEYTKVIEHASASDALIARSWLAIGQGHQNMRRFDEATVAYDKAVYTHGAEPDTVALALLFSGYNLNKSGKVAEGLARLKRVAEVDGASAWIRQQALISAGKILQRDRNYADALTHFERALEITDKGGIAEFAKNGVIECHTALNAEPEFFFSPYVSLVSATEATVFWVSLGEIPAGRIVAKGGGETIEATSEPAQIPDRDAFRQTVRLTGLKPYTLYEYTAYSGDHTAGGYFHTARETPGPIRWVTLGDTQTGWENHVRLAPLIAAENPDFVLHVGDCVDAGDEWDQWKLQMFDPGKPYLSKSPIWVARGNHDGGPYFPILFGREKDPWISFTFGDLRVYVLESTYSMGVRSGELQAKWLEEQLTANTSSWEVAIMHHSLFHTATGDLLAGQHQFRPLIEKHSPDLVLNGHYHKYSRQLPIGAPGQKPLINIVTGGGGGGNGTPSTLSPMVEKVYESFHYCVFEIEGNTLRLQAKDIEGKLIDEMTWTKGEDGLFQKEVMDKAFAPETFATLRTVYNDLKFPSYARLDLTGTTSAQDGQPVVVLDRNVLDISKLPENTMLIIEAAPDTKWTVPKQKLNLSKGELTIKATPPADDATAQLRVIANVEYEGRLFEPVTYSVTLAK